MQILIFRPNAHWRHIGGGIVVIARDIPHARRLVNAHEQELGCRSVLMASDPPDDRDAWVLQEAFAAPVGESARVVLYSMNDG